MPVNFLTATQRERYCNYPDELSPDEIARHFHLDDADLVWIATKRRDSSRLGYALQLSTVRFLGAFLDDPTAVPAPVLKAIAKQIGVTDPTCVGAYAQSEQRWRHTAEIRQRQGYLEFSAKGVAYRLGRRLCAQCWTGTDRPSVLFEHARSWLLGAKVLLPGVTVLERLVAEVRARMEHRLWRLLGSNVTDDQRERLDQLLQLAPDSRHTLLEQLRKGPVNTSSPALVQALDRIETIRKLEVKLSINKVPPGRIAVLARFAKTARVSAIARLPDSRRLATLVALMHSLEASAQDDALEVLEIVLRDIYVKAESAANKARLRTLRDLDAAAAVLAKACHMVLNHELVDTRLRERIYFVVGQKELQEATDCVNGLVRPGADVYYEELSSKIATVKRFLPKLLRIIDFNATAGGLDLKHALLWLRDRPDHDPPMEIASKSWKQHIKGADGSIDKDAFAFCALEKLRDAIQRRDIFIAPSWRYADPSAGLLKGEAWETTRPIICRSLGLSTDAKPALTEITEELDATYRAVVARLPHNKDVRIVSVNGKKDLVVSNLDKLDEPPSLIALREMVKMRMPKVDLPSILLEVGSRTDCMNAFVHLTERAARATDLSTSLCAVLLAEACNTGPEPFVRAEVPALKRDRLLWIDQNYMRDDTMLAANATLVRAQSQIPLAQIWGGGDVASADGMRFVVPVRSVHAGPNPKYFNRGRGVTWYNLLSDQGSGLNAITVPGTLRDSLVLLAVVLDQQTDLLPTQIMTDTGAYSDVVFGLFRLLGFHFAPRLADIGGTRFWRIDAEADYGDLNDVSRHRARLERIKPHWDEMLRLAGSLKLGTVRALDIMRTLQVGNKPTKLALAIAEYGRIEKTIHTLNFIDDAVKRRETLVQLNFGEGRHALARDVFHGKRGELHQHYREGQEDQLSALGLVVNMIVYWNTIYMNAALDLLRSEGHPVRQEDEARLSPFGHDHINMFGQYSFVVPDEVMRGELRPLRTADDK
jgi:TnpA family transposase